MPLTLYQAWKSNDVHSATRQKDSTSEAVYVITGSDDHIAVEDFAKTVGPLLDYDLLRQSIDLERIAPATWLAVYKFGHEDSQRSKDDQKPTDPSEFSFDTTGGTGHIDVSRGTSRYDPQQAPDYKGAIGVKKEGADFTVEGVEPHPAHLQIQREEGLSAGLRHTGLCQDGGGPDRHHQRR